MIADLNRVLQVVLLVEGALGVYLLYWLNTASVRAFFRWGRRSAGGA